MPNAGANERGIVVTASGVEISPRLAALARSRLPRHQDRIWVGNALDWQPPRRFDLVHTGIDYVPLRRQHDYVAHLLRDVVAENGQVVIRAERVVPGQPDVCEQIRDLGFAIDAVLERRHPGTGHVRRTVSLRAR